MSYGNASEELGSAIAALIEEVVIGDEGALTKSVRSKVQTFIEGYNLDGLIKHLVKGKIMAVTYESLRNMDFQREVGKRIGDVVAEAIAHQIISSEWFKRKEIEENNGKKVD